MTDRGPPLPNGTSEVFETPYGILRRREARPLLAEAQNHRCAYCAEPMTEPGEGPRSVTIDHVIPKRNGGTSGWHNLVAACKACNSGRPDHLTAEEYFVWRTVLIRQRELGLHQPAGRGRKRLSQTKRKGRNWRGLKTTFNQIEAAFQKGWGE